MKEPGALGTAVERLELVMEIPRRVGTVPIGHEGGGVEALVVDDGLHMFCVFCFVCLLLILIEIVFRRV